MNRSTIFLFALLCSCSTLSAQMRSKVEARRIAETHFTSDRLEYKNIKLSVNDSQNDEYRPFFMFTDRGSREFVIISGDARMKPVLGTGFEWEESDEIPDGLSYLLEEYSRQYQYLQDDELGTSAQKMPTVPDVAPLMTTEWGQDSPYNDDCPSSCPSGCVATAMAQVMNYHKYPETGRGSFSYTSRTRRHKMSYDFSNAFFEWSKMQDRYSSKPTLNFSEERDAVANLLKACGVSVSMDYDRSGSGAYSFDIPYAMIHFFQYGENINDYERSYFRTEEWYRIIYSELKASRPVIYCGNDSRNGGHAFVIDGVRSSDGKFHVNWGWNGNYDGYYELDALDPATYRFSASQDMIVHISPDSSGVHEDLFYAEQFSCGKNITWGADCNAKIKELVCVANATSYTQKNTSFSGKVGIGVFDSSFRLLCSCAEKSINGFRTYSYDDYSFSFRLPDDELDEDSTYYIAPYIKNSQTGEITRVRTAGGRTDYVQLNGNDGGDEDPVNPNDGENSVWNEGFENKRIPVGWMQDVVQGGANWKVQQIVFTTKDSKYPEANNGIGYVSLTYKSDDIFSMKRSVTKLITDYYVPEASKTYSVYLACRKYNESADDATILTLFIDKGRGWELLEEIPVSSMTFWACHDVVFKSDVPYRLAFEGSLGSGAILFLDDISVSEEDDVMPIEHVQADKEYERLYSPAGVRVASPFHFVISDEGTKRFVK